MSTTKVTLALLALMPSLLAMDIRTLDGKLYEECEVGRVEPDAICVLFPGGGARIKFANLSEDIQARYGYDPAKAAEYEKAQAAKRAREDAYWRAVRTHQQARRQADETNSVGQAKVAATDANGDSPGTPSDRAPAAYGSYGGGRGGYGGYGSYSGGGYQGYGGSAEYVGVELAPRTGQSYGQFSGGGGYGRGSGGGYGGGYGGGGWGGGGMATYVGVQLAPSRFGGGVGGGAGRGGGGGYFGQGYR
jgi:hypothetical protein